MWRLRGSSHYMSGTLPYVRRHITVTKISASLNKTLPPPHYLCINNHTIENEVRQIEKLNRCATTYFSYCTTDLLMNAYFEFFTDVEHRRGKEVAQLSVQRVSSLDSL